MVMSKEVNVVGVSEVSGGERGVAQEKHYRRFSEGDIIATEMMPKKSPVLEVTGSSLFRRVLTDEMFGRKKEELPELGQDKLGDNESKEAELKRVAGQVIDYLWKGVKEGRQEPKEVISQVFEWDRKRDEWRGEDRDRVNSARRKVSDLGQPKDEKDQREQEDILSECSEALNELTDERLSLELKYEYQLDKKFGENLVDQYRSFQFSKAGVLFQLGVVLPSVGKEFTTEELKPYEKLLEKNSELKEEFMEVEVYGVRRIDGSGKMELGPGKRRHED